MNKIILIIIFIGLACTEMYAYDDTDTHPRITGMAIQYSGIGTFVKQNLGSEFAKGANSVVDGLKITDWISQGSIAEDAPTCRASNHFHNPRQSWISSNMSDVRQANAVCMAKGWIPTYSAVTWATGYQAPAPSDTKLTNMSGAYNWDKARADYYAALISLTTTVRESKFADTFSTLGHVMHLLQDMAVPAHTRNDFQSHLKVDPVYGTLETLWTAQPYENYVKINTSLVNFADPSGNFPSFSNTTVTNFWDTDQYTGSNPSADTAIGLAEYANANFFSDFTIFKGILDLPHSFPYPASSSVQSYEEVVDSSTGKSKTYLKKVGDGETVNHLAAYRWYFKYLPATVNNIGLYLDDKCHEDYASKLIPRAVGYSAGLLNYFFRGSIDITVPSNGVYSMIDATQAGFDPATAAFAAIKLKATNTTTTSESMTNGTIQLVVKYKVAQTDPFLSDPVETDADFSYIVVPEKNNISALYIATPTELNFDLSQNPIPLWATDVYLQVVFKGTLGNENGAVAVGFKDISEPTPVDIFNNMDKKCISSNWYNAGSPEAIAQVDTNHDGIAGTDEADAYAHDLKNIYLRFSPYSQNPPFYWASPTEYDFTVPYLAAGAHVRAVYILSDYMFNKGYYMSREKIDPADTWTHSDLNQLWWHSAVKRQRDYSEDNGLCGGNPPCYIDVYPAHSDVFPADYFPGFFTFRNTSMWWGSVKILINSPYPENSQCTYDSL